MDYEQVTLELSDSGIEASEFHGFLCGVFCQGLQPDTPGWEVSLSDFLPEYSLLNDRISSLWHEISTSLDDADMPFKLLLPEESTPIPLRAASLSHWCSGFISGYGLGSPSSYRQPEDVHEILQDFQSIARINAHVEESNDNETDLMELEEYVRMGTILLYLGYKGEVETE